jgi:SAM-dependent methyltransferase
MTNQIHQIYQPTQEEQSRQNFVGTLKMFVNGTLEKDIPETAESSDLSNDGDNGCKRGEIVKSYQNDAKFQLWSSLNYLSQNLLWESCGLTVDRLTNNFHQRAATIEANGYKQGTSTLNYRLDLPQPIREIEIHRQPGGYFFGQDDGNLTAALLYLASVEIYTNAKGFGGAKREPGSTNSGHQFAKLIKARYPDLKPTRILDLGCGVGHMTMGLKQIWPEAEVYGLDLSSSFIRMAHLWSSEIGLDMHWRQQDAANTDFESQGFDLIVSQILFHETWDDKLPAIFKEANRLLAKDGLFFNVDVPYQPERLSVREIATHAWQVQYNNEPFWTGFVDTDIKQALRDAGFIPAEVFADYQPVGGGREYFIFGASRQNGIPSNH